jgi:hypothetical protein
MRTVAIYNPSTGLTELHPVRISDEGIADWTADRERLALAGYPDRPPDHDAGGLRGWRVEGASLPLDVTAPKGEHIGPDELYQTVIAGRAHKLRVYRDDLVRVEHIVSARRGYDVVETCELPEPFADLVVARTVEAWYGLGARTVTRVTKAELLPEVGAVMDELAAAGDAGRENGARSADRSAS